MTPRTTTPLAAALMATTLLTACGDDPVEATVPTTVTVSPSSVSLQSLDETVQLTATVKDQNGQAMSGIAVAWTSSDPAVGTVDDSGLVTAVGNGTVTVTATAWSASGTAAVMVDQVPTDVVVDPATDTLLTSGDTLRLSADALDSNGNAVAGAVFAWASNDTLVAVVNDEGLVTGVSAGEVEVTATSEGTTGRAQLTVAAPVPTTVTISPDTVAFHALGQTESLAAEVRDQGGRVMEGEAVSWSSADTLVTTVDSAGRVTATGGGATTVAATAGSATATAVVTVTQSAGSVVISPSAATIAPGNTLRLAAEAFDENGHGVADAEFDWSSSDLSVVRVDGSGLATAAGEGRATVTAAADGARGTAEITVENPDRAALVALYNATDGPNWVDNTNWLTDAPLGEWYGVDTDASGRVVRLDLRGENKGGTWVRHGLTGEIPPELGNLTSLRYIYLHRNYLTGPIPKELVKLVDLVGLSLWENNLTGPIPSELATLASLRTLELGYNKLTGEVPPALGDLENLTYLGLQFNNLSGEIPLDLTNLANLRSLYLSHNDLYGSIPRQLSKTSHLEVLALGSNDLSGPIPSELGKLRELRYLGLDHNDLSDGIPSELGDLTSLEQLHLHQNRLSGTLPLELGNLTELWFLDYGGNDISGSVPRTFLNLPLLTFGAFCGVANVCVPGTPEFVSWLQGMEFTGGGFRFCSASDEAALTNLFDAMGGDGWAASDGWLDGPALEEWHGVQTDSLGLVTALHLSDNGLSGVLHNDIGRLTRLTDIRIDGNALTGRLPLSMTWLDLREFHYADTELCEPADDGFRKWLDGIDSLQGTGVGCTPLGDRDVLEAVYRSTGGGAWRKSRNWLSDKPLGQWHGVEVDDEGQVVRLELRNGRLRGSIPPELGALAGLEVLDLAWNDLSGSIPLELGDLSRLSRLNLEGNDLSGSIPSELGDLANLEGLNLLSNEISGPIPPELGDLASLRSLNLASNRLSGRIPPELGKLAKLQYLLLNNNDLTGPIPPELGDLASLRYVHLGGNQLSGPIPPELGGLAHLGLLYLNNNELSGPIPPGIGNIANLTHLSLNFNELSGPVPPAFAGLSRLRVLELARNPALGGPLPSEMTSLAHLDTLQAGGTGLCAPSDPGFRAWLGGVASRWIADCVPHAAYPVQAVQSLEFPVPLVAGEKALLRVFPMALMETEVGMPLVRARFYLNGRETHGVDIPGSFTPVPTEIDEGSLAKSANAEIPGRVVRPGLEMVIEIDPDSTLDPELGVTGRIPEEGRLAIEVGAMPLFDLTLVPFVWTETHDSTIVETIREMEEDRDHELFADMDLLPVGRMDVTAHAPVLSSSNNAYDLLYETRAIRAMEGGGGHYMGMMNRPVRVAAGAAYVPGRSSFSVPSASTIAHELGHNFSLGHAPCRAYGDPLFPYPDGSIGAWGYDFRSGTLVRPSALDLMSYCPHGGISDYHFTKALRFRLSDADDESLAGREVAESLLLWGGVGADTVPFLKPAFVIEAPPMLPDSAGDWRLAGRTSSRTELFSLSFAMPEIGDGGGQSGFVFVLPVDPSWEASLATITLSGPAGSFTLDGATNTPMAILRNPVTGQIRGFLRDLPQETQAAMDAAGQAVEPGLEVLFSRGIPAASEWRR